MNTEPKYVIILVAVSVTIAAVISLALIGSRTSETYTGTYVDSEVSAAGWHHDSLILIHMTNFTITAGISSNDLPIMMQYNHTYTVTVVDGYIDKIVEV